MSFEVQKFLILVMFNASICSFMNLAFLSFIELELIYNVVINSAVQQSVNPAFDVPCKKYMPNPRSQKYSLIFSYECFIVLGFTFSSKIH